MIRPARLEDVAAIQDMVNGFAARELLLPLTAEEILERLRDFRVAWRDGEIAGTVALHVTWEKLVELRSLTVREDRQGNGLGRELIEAALTAARELGATEVFTLTYLPELFEKFGFRRVDRESLPHKVWQDCRNCAKQENCDEIALTLKLGDK